MDKKEIEIKICETKYAYGYRPLINLPDNFIVSRDSKERKKDFKYGKDKARQSKL